MRFEAALADYGFGKCSLVKRTLLIGVGPEAGCREAVHSLPQAVRSFMFLEAPYQIDLLKRFLAAEDGAARAETLFVGTSHDYAQARREKGYEFAEAVATLRGGRYPAIRAVSLGDMERLFNGHRGFGSLGEIGPVFDALPNLEDLELRGNFELARPVRHDRIEAIDVWVDEVGVSGGRLSQETVANLLASRFPKLKGLGLDLDDGDRALVYPLPEAVLSGRTMPALEAVDMTNLSPEDEARLKAWREARAASRAGA